MTTPPPYGARTAEPSTPSDDDFGAMTVSGKPSNMRDTEHAPPNTPNPLSSPTPGATTPGPSDGPNPSAPAGRNGPVPPAPFGARTQFPGTGTQFPPHGAPSAASGAPMPGPGAAMPGAAAPTSRRATASKSARSDGPRGPRRARLQLRHIDPWTVLKFSCVLSIALFFVWLIVIGVLFGVLDAAGVVNKINDTVTTINGNGSQAPVTAGIVFGGAAIIGVVNIVLFIALSTIGSVVYNLCADLVGGIELTLSER
jgi:hypothetical protein